MENQWKEYIDTFIHVANKHGVGMLMAGGGAVNFHGYQRHSATVDFWIDTDALNLEKLAAVFREMGYAIESFPDAVGQKGTKYFCKILSCRSQPRIDHPIRNWHNLRSGL